MSARHSALSRDVALSVSLCGLQVYWSHADQYLGSGTNFQSMTRLGGRKPSPVSGLVANRSARLNPSQPSHWGRLSQQVGGHASKPRRRDDGKTCWQLGRVGAVITLLVTVVTICGSPAAYAGRGAAPAGRSELTPVPTPPPPPPAPSDSYLGGAVMTNSEGWGQLLLRSDAVGALVVLVLPASPMRRAGLIVGDVIVGLDDREIRNGGQVATVLRRTPAVDHVLTVVGPTGAVRTVRVHAESRPQGDMSAYRLQLLGENPGPANRFLYATSGAADPREALRTLDEIVTTFPTFAEGHAARAGALQAVAARGKDSSPETATKIRGGIANAVELDAGSLLVQTIAARVLQRLGDIAEAAKHAERAVAIDDTTAEAIHLLGLSHLSSDRPVDAVFAFRRALQLDPYDEASYRELSRSYRRLGLPEFAKKTDRALTSLRSRQASVAGHARAVALAVVLALAAGCAVPLGRRNVLAAPLATRRQGRAAVASLRDRVWLMEALGAVAAFSVALPFVGRAIGLSPETPLSNELLDHALPGALMLALSVAGLRLLWTERASQDFLSLMPLGVVVLGTWMTATHAGLLREALGGSAVVEVALVHSLPGVATVILAAMAAWLLRARPAAARRDTGSTRTKSRRRSRAHGGGPRRSRR